MATAIRTRTPKARAPKEQTGAVALPTRNRSRKVGTAAPTKDATITPITTESALVRYKDVPVDDATKVAATDSKEQARLARIEHKALMAWVKSGAKEPRPATPNLEIIEAAYAAGTPVRATSTKKSSTKTTKVERVAMTFLRNGVPMPPSANKFSCLAYQCTKNLDGDAPRVSASRLREILVSVHKIENPETSPFTVDLGNGFTIGAELAK